ncbi:hypothetical protein BZG36_03890 [Bifiguratus adelaidae]|uniref:SWR1-complex protein 4 n=1 Tax=Bifiguratus adelaidae TaxID=1938954 RepID=A0A261XXW4_9FUNG|nr:hypothetical protein BZG36_03890 [Bifiguratus adelaidae]
MTSSDIRDILQLGKPQEVVKKVKPAAEKKPEGIPRELFALIGGAPPLSLAPAYKAKPKLKTKAVRWDWRKFNPGRDDGLTLQHWVKASEKNDEVYRFVKAYKSVDIIEYTEAEYERHLTDPDWSKVETDYLMELCKKFDLRFPVITDRYDFPGKERSMEDLKARYYSVKRRLLKARLPNDGSAERTALLQQYSFDKAKELERKKLLESLFKRSKEEIDEEEALYVELRRLEANEKKLAKDREGLLKILNTHDITQNAGPSSLTGGSSSSPALAFNKKKLNKSESSTPTADGFDFVEGTMVEKKDKLTPGVYVRGQKITPVKLNLAPKVAKIMDELKMPHRPIMPTSNICNTFEVLQSSILNLLELKKTVDRLEHSVKVKKAQKAAKEGTGDGELSEASTGEKRSMSVGGSSKDAKKTRKA